jgi:phospholipase C
VIDKWGPGTRIPALIISPFAKKGYIDHTSYETVSILAFIEKRWGLMPLNSRDEHADPLSHAFTF